MALKSFFERPPKIVRMQTKQCRQILLNPLPHLYTTTCSKPLMGFIQFPFITTPTCVLQTSLIRLTSGTGNQTQTLSCSTESTHDQAGSRLHISYRKSTLPKSAKTSQVGMHFHQKPLPQKPSKQATMHIAVHAHTTHTSQHNALFYHVHVPTIPTSFQPHPPQCVSHPILNCTPNTSFNTQPSTIITIKHDTSFPANRYSYILIHNHYILHKTQHPTLYIYTTNTYFTSTGTLLPPKYTWLRKSTSTNQAHLFLPAPHCH